MHNIHFIVVNEVDNHEAAEEFVLSEISDWGTENNWRSIIGSVDEENNIHQATGLDASTRWEMPNLEKIKDILKKEIEINPYTNINKNLSKSNQLWLKNKAAEHDYYTYLDHPLDIWKDEIYAYHFNEVGITNLCFTSDTKKYIVAIDMHD